MESIRRAHLQPEIIEYISQYIKDKNLVSGDKLPTQAELVEMMDVSKTSLREALKILEARNMIEIVNGKGTFVKDGSLNTISAQIEFGKEKETIFELLEVRKSLDREIIHLVIQNAADEELDEIEKILDVLIEKYNRGEKQNKEDRQFHIAIYNSCHNNIIRKLMLSIQSVLSKLWDFPLGMKDPFTDTIPLHKNLFDSIRMRDVKKAQAVNDKIISMMCQEVKAAK